MLCMPFSLWACGVSRFSLAQYSPVMLVFLVVPWTHQAFSCFRAFALVFPLPGSLFSQHFAWLAPSFPLFVLYNDFYLFFSLWLVYRVLSIYYHTMYTEKLGIFQLVANLTCVIVILLCEDTAGSPMQGPFIPWSKSFFSLEDWKKIEIFCHKSVLALLHSDVIFVRRLKAGEKEGDWSRIDSGRNLNELHYGILGWIETERKSFKTWQTQ